MFDKKPDYFNKKLEFQDFENAEKVNGFLLRKEDSKFSIEFDYHDPSHFLFYIDFSGHPL